MKRRKCKAVIRVDGERLRCAYWVGHRGEHWSLDKGCCEFEWKYGRARAPTSRKRERVR